MKTKTFGAGDSFGDVAKYLRRFDRKLSKAIRTVLDDSRKAAADAYKHGIREDCVVPSVTAGLNGSTGFVMASGDDVLFMEFGSGVTYNGGTDAIGDMGGDGRLPPEFYPPDYEFGIGEYRSDGMPGLSHGASPNGWHNGGKLRYGVPAHNAMGDAYETLNDQEKLEKAVEDVME